ncbi:hypothetical protein J2X13_005540 [Aminobacter aminovorans]|nr:hypothetical protein [Aminobacter aminovorans]
MERLADVVLDQLEAGMFDKVSDVGARAGVEVVDAYDVRARFQKPLAEMRTKKTRPACYQYPLFRMHVGLCLRMDVVRWAGSCNVSHVLQVQHFQANRRS